MGTNVKEGLAYLHNRERAEAYDESCVNDFEGFKGVRTRPTVYIKSKGSEGIYRLAMELVQNSIDEFAANRCDKIFFEYNSSTHEIKTTDNGCGIPLSSLFKIVTKMHVGSKFDNIAYENHAGANGMGLTICNALSRKFDILSHRDGLYCSYHFERGEHLKDKDEVNLKWNGDPHVGVIVSLIPDETIFETLELNKREVREFFKIITYLNTGLYIKMTWDGVEEVFYSELGIKDLLISELKDKKIKFSNDGFVFINGESLLDNGKLNYSTDLVFNIAGDKNSCLISFVNSMRTIKHGTHVSGFRNGITRAINKYMKDKDYIPKSSNLEISGSIIRNYISGVISVKHRDPSYDSQTKEELTSSDIEPFMQSLVYNKFLEWLEANPKEGKRISDLVILEAKANYNAKKARESVIKEGTKVSLAENYDSSKFIPCIEYSDPEKAEMLIIEGDSAAGNVNSGRNDNQAILKLRGKITNIIKDSSDIITNDSIKLLIKQLGMGFGINKNINKLKFGKIIILTDADDDGAHIQSLLLGFFYKYYPELIRDGRIFIAQPPLKIISIKKGKEKHELYILNEKDHEFYLKEFIKYKFDLYSDKTCKKLSDGLLELYLNGLLLYGPLMLNRSNQLLIDPNILELSIIYYNDILSNKFDLFNELGVDVRISKKTSNYKNIDFDFGINHYFMKIDNDWIRDIYVPLIEILSKKIKLNSVHLRLKDDSSKIFKGTHFQTYKFISSFFEDGANIYRFKGLSETTAEVLRRCTLDPETRRLIQVTMNDGEKAEEAINLFLGKSKNNERKDYFKNKMD